MAECYFRPSLSYHLSLFCLFLSGRFTQVLLYIIVVAGNFQCCMCTCFKIFTDLFKARLCDFYQVKLALGTFSFACNLRYREQVDKPLTL